MTSLIKALSLALAILLPTSNATQAHEFSELKIDSISVEHHYSFLYLNLSNTVKGRRVVCAVFDSTGTVIGSTNWDTDNLATKVMVSFEGNDPATARCVFND